MVTGAGSIDLFRFLVLRSALQLELNGIRVNRRTLASKVLKRELNFKGTKKQLMEYVNQLAEQYHANPGLQKEQ